MFMKKDTGSNARRKEEPRTPELGAPTLPILEPDGLIGKDGSTLWRSPNSFRTLILLSHRLPPRRSGSTQSIWPIDYTSPQSYQTFMWGE